MEYIQGVMANYLKPLICTDNDEPLEKQDFKESKPIIETYGMGDFDYQNCKIEPFNVQEEFKIFEQISEKTNNLFAKIEEELAANIEEQSFSHTSLILDKVDLGVQQSSTSLLDRMVKDGIIVPVEHSQWATPIVPVVKKDSVRITADYSCTVNLQLEVLSYPLPKIEEQLAKVANGKLFCKLDITKAYWCFPVDEVSAAALTINTHKGLFRTTRLMFGCASATVIWTKEVIAGIEGLGGYFDDLVVSANDVATLKSRLAEVLRRLQANGLRLNLKKCSFFVDSVTYLGHEISASGIRPAKDGLQAIQELPQPANVSDLKKFLGMVSFYSKFVPGMASTAAP